MVSSRLLFKALIFVIFGLYCIKSVLLVWGGRKVWNNVCFLYFFLLEQTLKRY